MDACRLRCPYEPLVEAPGQRRGHLDTKELSCFIVSCCACGIAAGECVMRTLIALVVILYLVGVGVMLSPTVSARWNSGTPAELFASLWQELPGALAWPVALYHRLMDAPPPTKT